MLRLTIAISRTVLVAACAAGAAAQRFTPPSGPSANPVTTSKALLGKTLFWDEQMSSSQMVACGTCHIPSAGGVDPRSADAHHPGFDGVFGTPDDIRGTRGVRRRSADGRYLDDPSFGTEPQVTRRAALSMINAGFRSSNFWDGRAEGPFIDPVTGATVISNGASLEIQALAPPVDQTEMGHVGTDWVEVANHLEGARPLALATQLPPVLATWIGTRSYPDLFLEAFGTPDVTPTRIAMAIASYERTLVSDRSPADNFVAGIDPNALTAQQQLGLQMYQFDAGCELCHRNSFLGVPFFVDTGMRPIIEDGGRGAIIGSTQLEGAFRIPDLHNVGLRPVLFHNGGSASLDEAVAFYERGGDFRQGSNGLFPLALTPVQRTALLDFLENALTDPRVAQELPPFDRPTLYTESTRLPAPYGAGTAGGFGAIPELIAEEAALRGTNQLTIGVTNATAGLPATLLLGLGGSNGSLVANGAPLFVDVTQPFVLLNLGLLNPSATSGGHASLPLVLPSDPQIDGIDLFAQVLIPDPGTALGLAATAAAQLQVFAPR